MHQRSSNDQQTQTPPQRQLHQPTNPHRVHGRLKLIFANDQSSGQSILSVAEQQPPLKVVRAFPLADGAALVHLHNVSGGVLGGDLLEMAVEVGPQASVQLTTTSATRLYRHRPLVPDSAQINRIAVREGSLLEYLPDPLIPFAGARYRQQTKIELEADAGLFWWEVVAPGREARGELFEYDRLELALEIRAAGRPIALERNRLEPHIRPMNSVARMGEYRYFASFYICRVGLEAAHWRVMEQELSELADTHTRASEVLWGVSTLPIHGVVVRALSVNGRDIATGLTAFWRAAKLKLYGREAVLPRKVW